MNMHVTKPIMAEFTADLSAEIGALVKVERRDVRIDCLRRMGWTVAGLARQFGVEPREIERICSSRGSL